MLTTETIENIPVLYATGQYTIHDVAERCGCSTTTVKKYLKLHDLNPRGENTLSHIESRKRGEEMAALYATGQYTLSQIGDKYGVTKQAVHQAVKYHTEPKPHLPRTRQPKHVLEARERQQNAAADYLAGMSLEEAAAKHGYAVSGLRRLLYELGVKIRSSKYPGYHNGFGDEEYAEVERLRDSGWTQDELAGHMGCSRDIIRGMLARIKAMRRESE